MELDSDFFWLVGLLEGEGHFGLARSGKRSYAVIRLEMANEEVIKRAYGILKIGNVKRINPRKLHYKPTWVWQKSGKDATILMRTFHYYMSQYRKDQIDRVLTNISTPIGTGNYKKLIRTSDLPPVNAETRELVKQYMLQKRGIK